MRQSKTQDGNPESSQTADQLKQRAHDLIRQRPLLALTVALASGYLAGRVFSRV
jgi:hypothetical protein